MTYTCFDVTIENNIAHIVLNRPEKRNSMNVAFWEELPAIVHDIDNNSLARVIVVSSTGPHFTSGLDINAFLMDGASNETGEADPKAHRVRSEKLYQNIKRMQKSFSVLEECRVPALAAIQGGCIGGAVDMISAADCRYCTEDAFFSIEEINLGMTADLGTLQRLPSLISIGLVKELAYTGRRMPAVEAKTAGLVNNVYADHQSMMTGVMSIANEIAARSPLAVLGCKEMINYSRDHSMSDSLDYMAVWQSGMFQPQTDMMETFTAKAEKRKPNFDDLSKIDNSSIL